MKTILPENIDIALGLARRLRQALALRNIRIPEDVSVDLVSKMHGFSNWPTMRDGMIRLEGAQMPAVERTLSRLMRLDGDTAESVYRGVRAIHAAHGSGQEDPDAGQILKAACYSAFSWSQAHNIPLTPDMILRAINPGTGADLKACMRSPGIHLPRLLDLARWIRERPDEQTSRAALSELRKIRGLDLFRVEKGQPQGDLFNRVMRASLPGLIGPLSHAIEDARTIAG